MRTGYCGKSAQGVDLSGYSQAKLNAIARRLNERPRKTLDYETPAQRFQEAVASARDRVRAGPGRAAAGRDSAAAARAWRGQRRRCAPTHRRRGHRRVPMPSPARHARLIGSVDFARSFLQRWGCRGGAEVSLLELMSQLFREFDFGNAREAGCRFVASVVVMQLNLRHDRSLAYRMPATKSPVKTDPFGE